LAAEFALNGTMKLLLGHEGTDRDTVDDRGRSAAWPGGFVLFGNYDDKTEDDIRESIEI
jgi:hypothetical protein